MPSVDPPCNQHEEQIQHNTKKIAELETRANYKDQRINELIEDNKRIEVKIDALTETVNNVIVNSIKDDNDIQQRVIALETQIETQNNVLEKYKEQSRKQREEDRAKTNIKLVYITVVIAILTFLLTYFKI